MAFWSEFDNVFNRNGNTTKEMRFEQFLTDCEEQGFEVHPDIVSEFRMYKGIKGRTWDKIFKNTSGKSFDDPYAIHMLTGLPASDFLYEKGNPSKKVKMSQIIRKSAKVRSPKGENEVRELLFLYFLVFSEVDGDYDILRLLNNIKGLERSSEDLKDLANRIKKYDRQKSNNSKQIFWSAQEFRRHKKFPLFSYEIFEQFEFHYGSKVIQNIQNKGKTLGGFRNRHRWNPSDVYIIKPEFYRHLDDLMSCDSIKDYNEKFNSLVNQDLIWPVSLKATINAIQGSASLSTIEPVPVCSFDNLNVQGIIDSVELISSKIKTYKRLSNSNARSIKAGLECKTIREFFENNEVIKEAKENPIYEISYPGIILWLGKIMKRQDWRTVLEDLIKSAVSCDPRSSNFFLVEPSKCYQVENKVSVNLNNIELIFNTTNVIFNFEMSDELGNIKQGFADLRAKSANHKSHTLNVRLEKNQRKGSGLVIK